MAAAPLSAIRRRGPPRPGRLFAGGGRRRVAGPVLLPVHGLLDNHLPEFQARLPGDSHRPAVAGQPADGYHRRRLAGQCNLYIGSGFSGRAAGGHFPGCAGLAVRRFPVSLPRGRGAKFLWLHKSRVPFLPVHQLCAAVPPSCGRPSRADDAQNRHGLHRGLLVRTESHSALLFLGRLLESPVQQNRAFRAGWHDPNFAGAFNVGYEAGPSPASAGRLAGIPDPTHAPRDGLCRILCDFRSIQAASAPALRHRADSFPVRKRLAARSHRPVSHRFLGSVHGVFSPRPGAFFHSPAWRNRCRCWGFRSGCGAITIARCGAQNGPKRKGSASSAST